MTFKQIITALVLGFIALLGLAQCHPALADTPYQPTAEDIALAKQHWIEENGTEPPPLSERGMNDAMRLATLKQIEYRIIQEKNYENASRVRAY